jgi:hypothetical protein
VVGFDHGNNFRGAGNLIQRYPDARRRGNSVNEAYQRGGKVAEISIG